MTRFERLKREIVAEDRRLAVLPCTCENNGDLCPSCNAQNSLRPIESKRPRFTLDMFGDGLEWMHPVSLTTPNGRYRVIIEWKLDHYGIYVELVGDSRYRAVKAYHDYTAVERANRILRAYATREEATC